MPRDLTTSLGITKLWNKNPSNLSSRKGILVVDDEPAFCDLVMEVVSALGYKGYSVHSAEEALRTWSTDGGDIGLAFIDVVMPKIDGLTLISTLQHRDPDMMIVLVSGRLDDDTRWLANESGCQFLAKPFDVAGLAQLITEILGPNPENPASQDS